MAEKVHHRPARAHGPDGGDTLAGLEALVTIGPRLARDLRAVGITNVPTLRAVGIDEANRPLVDAGLQAGTYSLGTHSQQRWATSPGQRCPNSLKVKRGLPYRCGETIPEKRPLHPGVSDDAAPAP